MFKMMIKYFLAAVAVGCAATTLVAQDRRLDILDAMAAGEAAITHSPFDIGEVGAVFDGDEATLSRSADVNPMVITVAFTSPRTLARSRILFLGGQNRWRVETADNVTDLDAATGSFRVPLDWTSGDEAVWQDRAIDPPVAFRAIRLKLERLTGGNEVHLKEWDLFERAATTTELLSNGDFNALPVLGQGQTDVGPGGRKQIVSNPSVTGYSDGISGILGWIGALPYDNGTGSDHGIARPAGFSSTYSSRMVFINNWGRMLSQTTYPATTPGAVARAQIRFGTLGNDGDGGRAGTFYLIAGEADSLNQDQFSARSIILDKVTVGNPEFREQQLQVTTPNSKLTTLTLQYSFAAGDPALGLPLTVAFRTERWSVGPTYWDSASFTLSENPVADTPVTIPGPIVYAQNFDTLGTGNFSWRNNTTLPGWYAQINNGNTSTGTVLASDGTTSGLDGLLNLGSAGAADRALGSKSTSTGNMANIAYAVRFKNVSGRPLQVSRIRYTGELWHTNDDGNVEIYTLFSAIHADAGFNIQSGGNSVMAAAGTGFSPMGSASSWRSPTNTPAGSALNGNAAASRRVVTVTPAALIVPSEQYLTLKWTDANQPGTDGYQGLDDVAVEFTEISPGPELVVEQPAFTYPVSGTVRDFGRVAVNTPASLSFRVRNIGSQPLTGINAALIQPVPEEFLLQNLPPVSLEPLTGEAVLTVSCVPLYPGSKSALLRITSNDADESTLDIRLTATVPTKFDPGAVAEDFKPEAVDGGFMTIIPLSNGALLSGGFYSAVGGIGSWNLSRFSAAGALDTQFLGQASDDVNTLTALPNGQIIVGGRFTEAANLPRGRLARLNPDGSTDTAWTSNTNGEVYSAAMQADGKLVVTGSFTTVGGVARSGIARLNPNGIVDSGFAASAPGVVRTACIQVDGRIVIGGSFTTVNGVGRSYLARLRSDGTLDTTFNPNVSGVVYSTAIQTDGKILAGGDFTSIGGVARSFMVRLNPDGGLDVPFNPVTNARVRSIALQTDGKAVIAGNFTSVGGVAKNYIARLLADGSLDTLFSPNSNGALNGTMIEGDGRVLVAGVFTTIGGQSRSVGARLENDPAVQNLSVQGSSRILWLRGGSSPETHQVTFELSTDGGGSWTALGAGSRISGGWERAGLSLPATGLVRARARVVGGYGNGSSALVETVAAFPGPEIVLEQPALMEVPDGGSRDFGSIFAGGSSSLTFTVRNKGNAPLTGLQFELYGANRDNFAVTGSPEALVGGPDGSTVFTVTFKGAEAGLKAATLHLISNDADESRYEVNLSGRVIFPGNTDNDFNASVSGGNVNAVAVQPDGQVIIAGDFNSVNSQARTRIARLYPDGTLESLAQFNPGSGPDGSVTALCVQPNGRILLAGAFRNVNGQPRQGIARLNGDGSLESIAGFDTGSGPDGTVSCMALQPDGKILIGGEFTAVNGQSRGRIARLLNNGALENTAIFNAGSGAAGPVRSIVLQQDGRILLGGEFTAVNGQPRGRVARLGPFGALESTVSFEPGTGMNGTVRSLLVQPDGRILAAGDFTTVNDQSRGRVARLLSDGALEPAATFNPGTGADGPVYCMALQTDGRILLGGAFTKLNGQIRGRTGRLRSDGTVEGAEAWNTPGGANGPVLAIAGQANGAVLLGGGFTAVGGSSRNRLAGLINDPAEQALSLQNSTRVQWLRSGSGPELESATLDLSLDGGASWQPLGAAVRFNGGWQRADMALPGSGVLRARGRAGGSLLEQQLPYFFGAEPTVITGAATAVTPSSAQLNGTVTLIESGTVYFEYGPADTYGNRTPPQTITSGVAIAVQAPISGLSGDQNYHFRVVVMGTAGTVSGEDRMFTTAPSPPLAVTAQPVLVTTTGATLAGAVHPQGRATAVFFEYGTTALYGSMTPLQNIPSGASVVDITAPVTGLTEGGIYHCRLVASSAAGSNAGEDVSFVAMNGGGGIATGPPDVVTGSAAGITTGGATLMATVNPNGGATVVHFEYGASTSYGSISNSQGIGNGRESIALSIPLSDLTPGTVWHYRVVASNSRGIRFGEDSTLTTAFPPPQAVTGEVVALTTSSVRVTGTVRARFAPTQVFFDYGNDGVSFPFSLAADPASATGDEETTVSADLTNLSQGITYYYRVRAVSSGGIAIGEVKPLQVALLSGLIQQFPPGVDAAQRSGRLAVNFSGAVPSPGWRFAGERQWRPPGADAGGLTTGDRLVEYRPVPGWTAPPRETVSIISGEPTMVLERSYEPAPPSGAASLTVNLKPDATAAATVPAATRAQWRFAGEDDTRWRDSGLMVTGLVPGQYELECKPVAGRSTPQPGILTLLDGLASSVTLTYHLADAQTGTAPAVLSFSTVAGSQNLPYAYAGQLRTGGGMGSGFVVKSRVVATAGHVVFDDGTLSAAPSVQWLFQQDRGTHEPRPQIPRGFYLLDGYAAQRAADNSPGTSSPQSQNLDVAALYFLEDAGRGGFGGFLGSDLVNNEFLLSPAKKILVGYPVDGIALANQGRMHATPAANVNFSAAFERTWRTAGIRGSGGASGGPLCVQYDGGAYYPAAIYLGGTAQTIVRAIDSSVVQLFNLAEVSANTGANNTGGGITLTSVTTTGLPADPASIKVVIEPAEARAAGWRLSSESSWRRHGTTLGGLPAGETVIKFSAMPGFLPPATQRVTLAGGQLTQITFTYAARVEALEAWRLDNFGTTASTGTAANSADPDGDGQSNAAEYAAGTNPRNALDFLQNAGLSYNGSTFSLSLAGRTGRRYQLQRAVDPATGPWLDVSNAGPLAVDENVVLTDPSPPSVTGFYRIKITVP